MTREAVAWTVAAASLSVAAGALVLFLGVHVDEHQRIREVLRELWQHSAPCSCPDAPSSTSGAT